MRLHRACLLVSLAFVPAAACSTFSSNDTQAPGDAGGDDAPASTPPPAPPPPPPRDAGNDGPFCAGVDASFCWSFDEGADPLDGPLLTPFGSPTDPTLSDASLSPPHAMHAAVADSGAYLTSALTYAPEAGVHMRCDLWVFVESAGQGAADVLLLRPRALGTPSYALNVDTLPTDASVRLRTYIDFDKNVDIGNVPVGAWTPIALDVALTDGGVVATGVIPEAMQSTSKSPDGGVPPFQKLDVDFGLSFSAPGWSVLYDDIVCNWN